MECTLFDTQLLGDDMTQEVHPRIAIFGAGSIGSYLGGRLSHSSEISLIGRSGMAAMVAASGLTLTDLHGYRLQIAPEAIDFRTQARAASEAALVLVTVKSAATAEAARELAGVLAPDAVVISFQNGLHNAQALRERLPGHTVLAGMVPFNVVQREPGAFHQASSGSLMVEDSTSLSPFQASFAAAGMPLELRTDMPQVQAAKLLLNLNNAINALSGLPLRDELATRDWRRCLAMAQREALRIYDAAQIHPARLTPLPPRWFPRVLELPDFLFRRIASRMLAIDPSARSSTWDDLVAGRRTEVDYINGEIVKLAESLRLTAPVNARLVGLIREAELQRIAWKGAALFSELQSARG
jgi:2-dehydropantoate 2-reductase